jgi:2-polyprenyl-6-methoxyphenol hydroxylase-like FAD-dependent oxidoreductase
MNTTQYDAPVLIAGGGPVGMTLALELAHHGVASIVVEENETTTQYPKMDLTNARSMELFRRLGVADRMREVGVPPDHLLDIVWATSPNGHVLWRFDYPSPNRQRELARARNDGTVTSEPPLRVSQIVIEPVLKSAIDASPLVDVRFGWKFTDFVQDDGGVTATIVNGSSREDRTVRAAWLAGCDGGRSQVRRAAGIELEGNFAVFQAYSVQFRSTDPVFVRFGDNPPYHLQTSAGSLVCQNGKDVFTLHAALPPGTDMDTADPKVVLDAFVGQRVDAEIGIYGSWTPHVVVARSYRVGRVLLAGDSAHQLIPTGGYGMNSGIGDAAGLGWALGAVINGWGGESLLDAYETERRPIAVRNLNASTVHMGVRVQIGPLLAEAVAQGGIDEPGAAERRAELGRRLADLGNAENEMWGIEYDYRYQDSPIVWSEPGTPPPADPARVIPNTWPGSRLPMIFLADGTPLFDKLGREFTLVVIGDADPGGLPDAAATAGVPLEVVRLDDEPKLAILERPLILVRPDHHVAWRGVRPPDDAALVVATVTGRANCLSDPAAVEHAATAP